MVDTNRSVDEFLNASTGLFKDNSAGDISANDLRDFALSTFRPQAFCQGRLTTESGVPVSTSDRTAQGTIYFTPCGGGNLVGLYDGTSWKLHPFTERSLALSGLTSGKNYDIFLYDNAGTLTLELSAAWTNDTTRADALTTQDSVIVKSGATTRRWVGTLRTTATTTTEDSATKRFLWSAYNQAPRSLSKYEAATAHNYSTAVFREWNGGTGGPHRIYFVTGETQTFQSAGWVDIGGAFALVSFSLNDSTVEGIASASNNLTGSTRTGMSGVYVSQLGFNELIVTEYGSGTAAQNYYRLQADIFG